MPRVYFKEDFDWQPANARWMIAYKAGRIYLVKKVVAEQAIREGKAELADRVVQLDAIR